MPKKPPRNSYYFFMQDFREEQRKKGIMYNNMAEVNLAAGPVWAAAPPQLRAKFDALAKAAKAKNNIPERKFTSNGVCLADIEAAEQEKHEIERAEIRDIKDFVQQHRVSNTLQNQDIYLIDVNTYCQAGPTYLVGELSIIQFNIVDGIKDTYHEIINPGGIPIGYRLEIKNSCTELGLTMPDDLENPTDYMKTLAMVVDFLRRQQSKQGRLPALYTLPDKVKPVLNFLHQLCSRAVEDESIFRVYRLDRLFYMMAGASAGGSGSGGGGGRPIDEFPESMALEQIKKDLFKYSPGIGCPMHEENEKAVECTLSRAKRWAYSVLDILLLRYNLMPKPDQHLPPDYHVDSILALKEERREGGAGPRARVGAAAAAAAADVSDCSFGSELSYASRALPAAHLYPRHSPSPASGQPTESKSKKLAYVSMRKPESDYSMAVRAPPLKPNDFPALGGRGRGRTLGDSFDNMKL